MMLQVCCSPTNNTEVCIIGKGVFRLLSLSETVWKQYGFQKLDQINITSACWLSGDIILCGTSDGKLFYIENGDLKRIFTASSVMSISLSSKDKEATNVSSSLLLVRTASGEEDHAVRTLISFPMGFAFSCRVGYVHFFEKESENTYRKRNVFRIPDLDYTGDLEEKDLNTVTHLSINVSQDKLLATTRRAQIYSVRLWGPDINVAPEIPFKNFGEPLHFGTVMGLTGCVWKPIIATFGATDRTVRLWNYETETVQLVKQYKEEIYALDLHPTGSFIAVALSDAINVSYILMNDIQPYRFIPVRKCGKCLYSFRGNYIAAVNQSQIEIYGTIIMNRSLLLKGQIGKINAIRFGKDDSFLISCGSGGAIIGWDLINGAITCDIQNPGVEYLDLSVSSDGLFTYAVGNDGVLIEIKKSTVLRSFKLRQEKLSNVCLTNSGLLMLISGDNGALLSLKLPLSDQPEYSVHRYHASRIHQMRISYDDQTLITIDEKNAMVFWKLNFSDGKTAVTEKSFVYSNEILINKAELEKKISTLKDLARKLQELELVQAREVRDVENSYCDKIKGLHDFYGRIIEELREKINLAEQEQNDRLKSIKEDVEKLKEDQKQKIQELVQNYMSKLSVEHGKIRNLESIKEQTFNDFEIRMAELEQSKEEETNAIITSYNQKLEDVNNFLRALYKKNVQNAKDNEVTKVLMEEDADREIVESKARYEGILREERKKNEALKEETISLRKKHSEAVKEKEEFHVKVALLQEELQKYHANIQSLEKDIVDLKAEIVERDAAIDSKNERICQLKKKIQELEKFKFVLDYKIKELKNQIDPKDRELKERKEQIEDMAVEVDSQKKTNSSLELQLIELKEKINGTKQEVNAYEIKHNIQLQTLRQMKVDIYELYQNLSDYKKLKDGIMSLSQKYHKEALAESDFNTQIGDTDLQKGLILQRGCLEKTIIGLKSTAVKYRSYKTIEQKVVQDNVVLLVELNTVRKELKKEIRAVRELEKLIGITSKKSVAPSVAFKNLEKTLKERQKIKKECGEIIQQAADDTKKTNERRRAIQDEFFNLIHNTNP